MESSGNSVFSDMVYNCKGQIVLLLSEREGLIQTYINGQTCAYALFFLKDLYIYGTNERKYSEILSYLRYTSYVVSLDAKRVVFLPSLKNKMEDISFDRLYFAPKVWVGERPHCSTSNTYWDIQSILPQLKISLSLVFKQTTLNFSNELHLPPRNWRHQLTDVSGRVIHILNSKDAILAVEVENLSLNIIFSIHFLYISNHKCDENKEITDYVQLGMLLHCNARKLQNDSDIFMATCIWNGTKPSPVDIFSACVPKTNPLAKLREGFTYTGIVVELSPPNAALLLTTVRRKIAYVVIEIEKLSLQENDEPLSMDSCIDDYVDLTDIVFFQIRPAKNTEEFYFAQHAWLPLKMEINENIYMVSDDYKLRLSGWFLEKAYRDYQAGVEMDNVGNTTAIEIATEWSRGNEESTQEVGIIKLNETAQSMQTDYSICANLSAGSKNSIINGNASEWLHENNENAQEFDIIKLNETKNNMQTDSSVPCDFSVGGKNSFSNVSFAEWSQQNQENIHEVEIMILSETTQNMQTDSNEHDDLSVGCKNSFLNDSEDEGRDIEIIFSMDNQNSECEDKLVTETQYEINTKKSVTVGNSSCVSKNVSENPVLPVNTETEPENLNCASEQFNENNGVASDCRSSLEKHQQSSEVRDFENDSVSVTNENLPEKFSWADEEPEENDVPILNSEFLSVSNNCSTMISEIKEINNSRKPSVLQQKDSSNKTKMQNQNKNNSSNECEPKRNEFTIYKNSGYKINGEENNFKNCVDSSQSKITNVSVNRDTVQLCTTGKGHYATEHLKNGLKYLTDCKKLHYIGVPCRVVALMTEDKGLLCLGDDSEAEFFTESLIGISADCVHAGMEMKCIASCTGYKKFVAWYVWCGDTTPPKATEISQLLDATSDALNTLAANALYASHVIALAPYTALLAIKIRRQDIPVLLTGDITDLDDLSVGDFLEVKVRKVPFGSPQSKCFYWEASEVKRGLSFAEELMQLKEFSYKGFLRKSLLKTSKTNSKVKKHSQKHSSSSHLLQDVDERTNVYDSKSTSSSKDKNYDSGVGVPSKPLNVAKKSADTEKKTLLTENKEHTELKNECSTKEESNLEVTGYVESVCCWYAMIAFELSGKTEKALCYKNALITNNSLPLPQLLTVGKCVKLNIQLLNAPFQGACYRAANVEVIEEQSSVTKTDLKINTTNTKRVTFADEQDTSVRKSETQILGQTFWTRNTLETKGQIAKVKPMIHQQTSTFSLNQSFTYHSRTNPQPREFTLMTNRGGRQYLTATVKSHAAKIKNYISENEAVMETNVFGVILDVRFTRNLFELPSYSRSLSLQDFLCIGQDVYFDACITRPLDSDSPSLFTVVVKGVWQGRRQRRFNSRRLIPLPVNSPRQLREGPVYRTTVVEMRPPFAFVVEEMFGHEKIFVFNRAFRPDGEHGDNMLANQPIGQYVQLGDEILLTVYRNSPEYQFEWSARDAWPARSRITAQHQKGKVAFIEETWGLLTTSFEAVMLQNENIYRQGQPVVTNNLKDFIKKGDILCFKMSPANPGNRYPGKTTAVFLECQC